MTALATLLHKQNMRELSLEGREKALEKEIFNHHRNAMIRLLCSYIRLQWEAKQTGLQFKTEYHSADWCNAAVQILTYCEPELQAEWLNGDDSMRTRIVDAVLADEGVTAFDGHFYELPPL